LLGTHSNQKFLISPMSDMHAMLDYKKTARLDKRSFEFVEKSNLNFSKFVRKKVSELMEKEKK